MLRKAVPGIRVLVVDDDSPDGTADVARALAVEHGDVEVVRPPRPPWPRVGVPRRVPPGDRRRGRRLRPDRRRPVPRPGRPAGAARQRRARRRPGDRQPVRPRRAHRELAVAAALAVAVGQPLRRRRCSGSPSTTPPPATGRTGPTSLEAMDFEDGRRRGLRLPDRDDPPPGARRWPHRRVPDRVPRPPGRQSKLSQGIVGEAMGLVLRLWIADRRGRRATRRAHAAE